MDDEEFWDDAAMARWEQAVDELYADFTGQRQPQQDPVRAAVAAMGQPLPLDLSNDDGVLTRQGPDGRPEFRYADPIREAYRRSR